MEAHVEEETRRAYTVVLELDETEMAVFRSLVSRGASNNPRYLGPPNPSVNSMGRAILEGLPDQGRVYGGVEEGVGWTQARARDGKVSPGSDEDPLRRIRIHHDDESEEPKEAPHPAEALKKGMEVIEKVLFESRTSSIGGGMSARSQSGKWANELAEKVFDALLHHDPPIFLAYGEELKED